MGSIKLSPKHGVNPSVPTCFWCGEAMNMLVLFGRLPNDKEAGMHCGPVSYEPCDKCKEQWDQGILLMEAGTSPQSDGQPELHGAYPTGRYMVMRPEAVERVFNPDEATAILKSRKAFLDFETFEHFLQSFSAAAPE